MNDIVNKQNELESIQMLGARNSIYRTAKQYSVAKFYICVVSVIIFTYLALFINDLSDGVVFYSSLIFFVGYMFDCRISALKKSGAKAQNMLDLYLFNIQWDESLFGKKPEFDTIRQEYAKYIKRYTNTNKLVDWYAKGIENVPFNIGKLLCQKSSCRYDYSLRDKLYSYICIVFIVSIISILIAMFGFDLTLKNIFFLTIAPLFPIIQWGCTSLRNQRNALKKNEELNQQINESWKLILEGQNIVDSRIEKLQSMLYQYRCENPLIPDWFYYKYRSENEQKINFLVNSLIKEYKKAQP